MIENFVLMYDNFNENIYNDEICCTKLVDYVINICKRDKKEKIFITPNNKIDEFKKFYLKFGFVSDFKKEKHKHRISLTF